MARNGMSATVRAWATAGMAVVLLAVAGGPTAGQGAPPAGKATVTLTVPEDAKVFFDGVAMPETGRERKFTTPVLVPGMDYHYNILVRWKADGKDVERRRTIQVSAGAKVAASFVDRPVAADPMAKEKDRQVVTSVAVKRALASSVNFKKAFGLPFDSLGTLGARIEAARRSSDPVALAHAAIELSVAEKVSKKKASLTSNLLIEEAAELAKVRRQASELKALFLVKQAIAAEATDARQWDDLIAIAEQTARNERDAVRSETLPADGPRRILLNNYTTQQIDLWVNGTYKIQVPPGGSKWCVIEHKWNPTRLTAYGDEDEGGAWHRTIWGEFKTYTWNLE